VPRPDELDLAAATHLGEVGIFGEEAITWMNRLNVADLGRTDDAVDQQIAFRRRCSTDAIGLVGERQVLRSPIGFTEYRDGLNTHLAASAHNSQRDFTPVGDENSLEHFRLTGADTKKWLSELDGIAVLREDFDDCPAHFRRDLIEYFHGFHNADHCLRRHCGSNVHEGGVVGCR